MLLFTQYSSTSSATKLKAKFGQGRNCDINANNKSSPIIYSKVNWLDRTDGGNIKSNAAKEGTKNNKSTNVEKYTVSFTPPTPRKKTGGIGLKWESQHSQEVFSSSLSSWKGNKNILSKSHSNIQELAIDDGRGFIPSEVAKDPNQKEFLINLSKRIFSNPGTKVIKEEMHRRRTEETNAENRKRSASAGRSAGLDQYFHLVKCSISRLKGYKSLDFSFLIIFKPYTGFPNHHQLTSMAKAREEDSNDHLKYLLQITKNSHIHTPTHNLIIMILFQGVPSNI